MYDKRTCFHEGGDVRFLLTNAETGCAVAEFVRDAIVVIFDEARIVFVDEAQDHLTIVEGSALEAIVEVNIFVTGKFLLKPVQESLFEGLALALINNDTLVVAQEHPAEPQNLREGLTIDKIFCRNGQTFQLMISMGDIKERPKTRPTRREDEIGRINQPTRVEGEDKTGQGPMLATTRGSSIDKRTYATFFGQKFKSDEAIVDFVDT